MPLTFLTISQKPITGSLNCEEYLSVIITQIQVNQMEVNRKTSVSEECTAISIMSLCQGSAESRKTVHPKAARWSHVFTSPPKTQTR